MRPLNFLILLAVLALPQSSKAQRASLTGIVVDSATGAPLGGVTITLLDLDIATATDSRGAFQFFGIGSGEHTVSIRRVGFQPVVVRFRLNAAADPRAELGTFQLTRATATELDPIRVQANLVDQYPQLESFFRRMRTEHGTFLTEADIQREAPQVTSDLIRKMPGFRTDQLGQIVTARGGSFRGGAVSDCRVQYFVNGVEMNSSSLDVVLPNVIVGMEVYSGIATIPPIYRKGNDGHCGVIAVWTRHTRR